jgi:two-component system chemotaxis response regulator CheB
MGKRNIVVIGASSGGFDAIVDLFRQMPATLDVAFFIVRHIAPDIPGVLQRKLNSVNQIFAEDASDREKISFNRIYIAPPDRHMLIEKDHIRVSYGPKENRFRPAIDPLFRSAAYWHGNRVIGIVLSGALDDGTSGLWTIKKMGGVAIVQDPAEADFPAMPLNAIREVEVDYKSTIAEMPAVINKLISEDVPADSIPASNGNNKIYSEIKIAMEGADQELIKRISQPSLYTCPECHGVLSIIQEGPIKRFRCHTGHAFSPDSLLSELTGNIESNLWNAVRSMQESVFLLNELGDHYAEMNVPKTAASYFLKAKQTENRIQLILQILSKHEQLSNESIERNS